MAEEEEQATEWLGMTASPPFFVRWPPGLLILLGIAAMWGISTYLKSRELAAERAAAQAQRAPPPGGSNFVY